MIERQMVKQTAELLRGIIRSIDKKLEYSLMDQTQEGRFSLRRNAVRQKIKSTRDHLLSNYVVDVMGKRVAKMLKQAGGGKDEAQPSFFRRPQGRRR